MDLTSSIHNRSHVGKPTKVWTSPYAAAATPRAATSLKTNSIARSSSPTADPEAKRRHEHEQEAGDAAKEASLERVHRTEQDQHRQHEDGSTEMSASAKNPAAGCGEHENSQRDRSYDEKRVKPGDGTELRNHPSDHPESGEPEDGAEQQ